MSLELSGIRHAFGTREVLRGIDLTVGAGEILCLLGPSGDGKTTLLRLVAGLEALQVGRIAIGGRVVAEAGREEPPEARRAGFVFQDYALFPHLTVARNVGFGLGALPRAARAAQVAEALERVGLGAFAEAYPHMLSGGQQQRVALARALAPRPAVLLLDEAFASLDARLRERVRDDTLHVLQSAGIATLIVTHDAEEAMFMADRIALLRGGRVEQLGTPEELYLRPASRFVATFLGEVNALPATVSGGVARAALGSVPAALPDGPAELLLRPEGLRLLPEGQGVAAVVEASRLLGASTMVHLAVPGGEGGAPLHLHARLPPGPRLARGDRLGLALDPERAFVFSAASP
ncbi:ABC transporter ATP-binding protein [Teichococcus aestuarii]|uniref:ABC transporter ATP-binding protein n=1 Tax=Teichococcus aestuarii TaxID=568898 RepID=A0A2U1V0C6_9PROT|nr:ABC transporter ATP-binding protein [Pseudoroseomonas aestuarii]PWC27353.1 ABC transporter ATP-binding protein [Pseudoroseomonas aestuarii]